MLPRVYEKKTKEQEEVVYFELRNSNDGGGSVDVWAIDSRGNDLSLVGWFQKNPNNQNKIYFNTYGSVPSKYFERETEYSSKTIKVI